MSRRFVLGLIGALLLSAGSFLGASPSAEASTARERIMEKRMQSGKWDCSAGTCRLLTSSRTAREPRSVGTGAARAAPQRAVSNSAAAPPPGGGKRIDISIAEQRLRAWEGNRVVINTAVSTGRFGHATPTGNFRIQGKYERYWSRSFGVWMPYAMRVVGGIFIHETPITTDGRRLGVSEIGSPVSAGCIRVPIGAAQRLFRWTPVGTPVIIH